LLQTPAYALAHVTAVEADITDERSAAVVRTRMERRRVLSPSHHSRFTFYVPEHPSMSDGVSVRDSKNPTGPMLTVPTATWRQLLVTR
jgi:Domain of unknown function (DUF397)/Domain of unknown function (DUF5753)